MLYRPLIIAVILLAVGFVKAFTQPLFFENYSSRQGLSQHNCVSVAQDRDGFMWFATLDGLNRYDGHSFKVFLQQNEAGRNLPSNAVFSLFYDHHRNLLLIGTMRGACVYNPTGDSLAKFSDYFPFARQLDNAGISKILSFAPHQWWILTFADGLYYIDARNASIRHFFTDASSRYQVTDLVVHQGRVMVALQHALYELIPNKGNFRVEQRYKDYPFPQVRALASYDNRLWVGTISQGCYYIEETAGGRELIKASDLVVGGVESMATGIRQELWIMTRGSGIIRYHAPSKLVQQAKQDQYDPLTPISNFGAFVFTDRQGIVWLGVHGGIAKFDPLRYQFKTINGAASRNASLTDNGVYCLYQCKDGTKLVGTQGKGLFAWDDKENNFTSYPASATVHKANNVIYSITEDEKGRIWSATCGGLMLLQKRSGRITYYHEKNKFHRLNKMYGIIKLRNADSLLLGTDDGLQFFSLKKMKWEPVPAFLDGPNATGFNSFRRATGLLEEEGGKVWLCNETVGLARYSYPEQKLEVVETVNALAKGVKHFIRYANYLVLATNNGLILYDDRLDRVIRHV